MKTLRNVRDLVSLVCLPLLVVVLAMWVRSYIVLDRLSFRDYGGMDCRLRSDLGRVTYFETTALYPHRNPPTELNVMRLPEQDFSLQFWESLPFQHEARALGQTQSGDPIMRSVTKVPYWFLFGMLSIAPGCRYAGWRSERTRRRVVAPVIADEVGPMPAEMA